MVADSWAFGWTPLLTMIGFAITSVLGITGIRTFRKWKREIIEERRLETAIEALSLAYESKYVFDGIRSPMSFEYEWKDMPETPGETEAERHRRGSFYAITRRVTLNKDFFERAFRLQPKCMAMFGSEAEDIFMLMHKARRAIEVSSQMLAWKVGEYENPEVPNRSEVFYEECRRDIWNMGDFKPEQDKVGMQLNEFRKRMEKMFRPIIGADFKKH
jgi:hypothetical protein